MSNTVENARIAFQAADDAWSAELAGLFGKRAGDVRYTPEGRGAPGSVLRLLHDDFVSTQAAWYAAVAATRIYR